MKCIVTWDLTPAYALSIAFLRVRSDKVIRRRTVVQTRLGRFCSGRLDSGLVLFSQRDVSCGEPRS